MPQIKHTLPSLQLPLRPAPVPGSQPIDDADEPTEPHCSELQCCLLSCHPCRRNRADCLKTGRSATQRMAGAATMLRRCRLALFPSVGVRGHISDAAIMPLCWQRLAACLQSRLPRQVVLLDIRWPARPAARCCTPPVAGWAGSRSCRSAQTVEQRSRQCERDIIPHRCTQHGAHQQSTKARQTVAAHAHLYHVVVRVVQEYLHHVRLTGQLLEMSSRA